MCRLPGRRGQPHFPKRNPVVPRPPTSRNHCCAIPGCGARSGGSVTMVSCEPRVPQKSETLGDDLQTSCVVHIRSWQVQITHVHVGGDMSARFTANSGSGALQCKPSPAQHPSSAARCGRIGRCEKLEVREGEDDGVTTP